MGNIMKKLSTLFTTTVLALGMILIVPSAMADPEKGSAKSTVALCKSLIGTPNFVSLGICISSARKDLKF